LKREQTEQAAKAEESRPADTLKCGDVCFTIIQQSTRDREGISLYYIFSYKIME